MTGGLLLFSEYNCFFGRSQFVFALPDHRSEPFMLYVSSIITQDNQSKNVGRAAQHSNLNTPLANATQTTSKAKNQSVKSTLRGKFAPTTRANDCPVCGDISGKCRAKNDGGKEFVLCMTHADARKFESVGGWKCIKTADKSQWATFTIGEQVSQSTREERAQQRAQREAEAKAVYQSGLSAKERHQAHTALLAQLTLHPDDRANLIRRGLSESAIEGFRSIAPWQELSQGISDRTPGSNGQKLLSPYAGYLVPARDLGGNITGCQIRNRATSGDAPKYVWQSTTSRPVNLQNGELPLTFAGGKSNSKTVYFAEGILKPFVAAEKHGQSFIGAAGGNFASSPKQLTEWLARLNPSELILCPDAGAIANPSVMRSYTALYELLRQNGYQLKVLWYGQISKSFGDIDEISPEEFAAAEVIGFGEFIYKYSPKSAPGLKAPKTEQTKTSALEEIVLLSAKEEKELRWLKAMAEIAGLSKLSTSDSGQCAGHASPTREGINAAFTQSRLLPQNHTEGFYEPLSLAAEGERKLYVLDGQKGTRKTSVAAKSLVDAAKASGQTCLVITPTRLLAKDGSRVLRVVCHLENGAESAPHLITCPESIWKFTHQRWRVVILDEVNEDVRRSLDGSLGVNPVACQGAFKSILAGASTIAIANDQMYRVSVQAIARMANISPQETVTIQRKRPQDASKTIKLYLDMLSAKDEGEENPAPLADIRYVLIAEAAEAIEAGKIPAIPCGSQMQARDIDRAFRAYFKGKLDKDGRRYSGQIFDGKHTPTKVKSDFASDPDAWLEQYRPHWLIWTPCFNSGVSIESDYLTAQFEFTSVFEGSSAASQRGERVRSVLKPGGIDERHVFLSNRGLPAHPDPKIFTAKYWRDLTIATATKRATPIDRNYARAIGADKYLAKFADELLIGVDEKPELFEYWAIEAQELYFKREALEAEWRGNGWKVEQAAVNPEAAAKWKALIKAARQGVIESQSRSLAKAKGVAAESKDIGPIAAVKAHKFYLQEQLGEDFERLSSSRWLEAWAIAPDNSGGIKSQRINALLKINLEAPELWDCILKLDTLRTVASATQRENLPSLMIPAKEIAIAKLLINCPGVAEVVRGSLEVWDNTLDIVKNAAKYLRELADELATLSRHNQRILGLQFTSATPVIKCFHKALSMAGVEAASESRGGKLRRYRLKTSEDCDRKIEEKQIAGKEPTPAEYRDLMRTATKGELRQRLQIKLQETIGRAIAPWQEIQREIAQMCGGESPSLLSESAIAAIEQATGQTFKQAGEQFLAPLPTPQEFTKPPALAITPGTTPGAAADWVAFERGLLEAKTFTGLLAAKDSKPLEFRREVMATWQEDGRYEWLDAQARWLERTAP